MVLGELSSWIDNLIGIKGSSGYLLIFVIVFVGNQIMSNQAEVAESSSTQKKEEDKNDDDEKEPPRNFTVEQLSYFDGQKDPKTDEPKPVYLSVNGIVFDVSDGRNFYGPDGPYEAFAGKECGVALAKMSFDTSHLNDLAGIQNLNFGEKTELEGWIEKFTYYRNYPIMGRLIADETLKPLADRILTSEDLAKCTGEDGQDLPEGYASRPIYIGAGDKVFDASFGGVIFYGAGGGYNKFAGKDISRALAKMSFAPEDLESTNVDDLEEKQLKVLDDWIKTFEDKKKYPIVGRLKK